MKNYRAIFFDWDGTAVVSRKAPVDEAVRVMKPLLSQGTKLIIVSGTTIENIAGGNLESYFTKQELQNLYLGLGRGAYNYAFDENGKPFIFKNLIPNLDELKKIHQICFDIHMELLEKYDFQTDIVFSRPNYCKIDLMVECQRGDHLFMQENELEMLRSCLEMHGIKDGLKGLLDLSEQIGRQCGIEVSATCDAKYLEVGISSKSDNVDTIYTMLREQFSIKPEECTFWGDEYVGIEDGIYGSDSYMKTEQTKEGDFYDVSNMIGERPDGVKQVGGGVERFLEFLETQEER